MSGRARLLFPLLVAGVMSGRPAWAQQYGLEWPGDGAVRRMLYWSNPFPIYDATFVFKVYPREKFEPFNYYTAFFWGNNGTFTWDGGNCNTYYGAHPYPIPAPTGPGQWEISVYCNDIVTGSEVEWGRWYTQAFRAWRESASVTHHEFYYDLPDTTKVLTFTIDDPGWADQDPPSPAIVMGQAPDVNGVSWGGYPGWEEWSGIIRGIQIYSDDLSVSDVLAEIDAPMSTPAGLASIWYLNLDPRPTDVTDKKGVGVPHDPAWDGTTALPWTGSATPARRELSHGSSLWEDLGGQGGTAGQDVFRLAQAARSSYEVSVDGVSGLASPAVLERVAADDVTVLQTGTGTGAGGAVSLRWENTSGTAVTNQSVRVRSGSCSSGCGPDDRFRLRAWDTTYSIARFNDAGSQVTVLMLQNPGPGVVSGRAHFWSASGAWLATQPFTLAGHATLVLNTAGVPGLAGESGSVTVAHDGGYGGLAGKAVSLEPATGFTFDSQLLGRPP